MTEQDNLRHLLLQAMPPVEDRPPSRNLWPEVLARRPRSPNLNWLDLGAAVAVVLLLSLFPGLFWLLLYHL